MNINISKSQVECFLEILKTHNFSETGENLFVAQSVVSKRIAALEKELGFLLFERRGRTVFVTPEGRELARYFTDFIRTYNALEKKADDIRRDKKGNSHELRIALIPFVEKLGIISDIKTFLKKSSTYIPRIDILDENQIISNIPYDNYDLFFLSDLYIPQDKNFLKKKYCVNRFMLVMSKENPLACRKEIAIKDLANTDMIMLPAESMLLDQCIQAFEKEGLTPNIIMTTNRTEIAFDSVRTDNTVFMTNAFGDTSFLPADMAAIPLKNSPEADMVFLWKKAGSVSSIVSECVDYCINNETAIRLSSSNG